MEFYLQTGTLTIFGNMKFSISDFIQLSIFLISLSVFAQKPVPLYLRLFPLYLFLLMIMDMAIEYTSPLGIHNTIISNTGGIAEFSFYFFELFQKTETQSLTRLTSFWIVSGILFNAVLIFPIFALISFMDNLSKANQKTTYCIRSYPGNFQYYQRVDLYTIFDRLLLRDTNQQICFVTFIPSCWYF